MNSQQLLDHIIVTTLKFMGRNYDSKKARMLVLSTSAIESNCGHKIKQDSGPALGVWQMEPVTHNSIWVNCDALRKPRFSNHIKKLMIMKSPLSALKNLLISPMYSCAMARLKYAMDKEPLPPYDDIEAIYHYYKRIYNTPIGKSTLIKFKDAWHANNLHKIILDNKEADLIEGKNNDKS